MVFYVLVHIAKGELDSFQSFQPNILSYLSEYYSNTAKISYELRKLKERGLINKQQGSNYYLVT